MNIARQLLSIRDSIVKFAGIFEGLRDLRPGFLLYDHIWAIDLRHVVNMADYS